MFYDRKVIATDDLSVDIYLKIPDYENIRK
ncbi:hypothetical protein MgSA37_03462 [Mucilaginibacter gotjawali]|uniref:Uncharacterized protein n=1 Tax=Mucilaginibacter gotjawali TaxID=1550579 RepID=A0A0X8X413_9SPHI|nr:hypothetical protein MgSA37_03462 [Mucilaginibacter gotjawali]